MMDKNKYRIINSVREENPGFYLVLLYVSHFYKNIIKCETRRDSPDTLIKYSRDWEYPWALIRSEAKPDDKILDCGSGYSPLPSIWSSLGAKAYAIDKSPLICSRFIYALRCIALITLYKLRFPPVRRKVKGKKKNSGFSTV